MTSKTKTAAKKPAKSKAGTSPKKPTKLLGQTPSQTVGPFFAYGLTPEPYGYNWTSLAGSTVARQGVPGEHIRLQGRVLDGKGDVIRDAMVEIRQADSTGRLTVIKGSNAGFTGFGRCGTGSDPDGFWHFDTVKPGRISAKEAPRFDVIVTMRGLLLHAFTRIYLADQAEANIADPVMQSVPAARRRTLLASEIKPGVYQLDIHMQGKNETVFFDL